RLLIALFHWQHDLLPAIEQPDEDGLAIEFVADAPIAGDDILGCEGDRLKKMMRDGASSVFACLRRQGRTRRKSLLAQGSLCLFDCLVRHTPSTSTIRCRPGRGTSDPGNLH